MQLYNAVILSDCFSPGSYPESADNGVIRRHMADDIPHTETDDAIASDYNDVFVFNGASQSQAINVVTAPTQRCHDSRSTVSAVDTACIAEFNAHAIP